MNYTKFFAWQAYFAAFIALVFFAGGFQWGGNNAGYLVAIAGVIAIGTAAGIANPPARL